MHGVLPSRARAIKHGGKGGEPCPKKAVEPEKQKDQKMEKGSNGTKQPCQPNIEQSERETSLPQREGP